MTKRFLIVEDNLINQELLKEILERLEGYVDVVEDGKMALEKLVDNTYHVIFMDIQMPVMDGYQTTHEIRKTNQDIPIIAVTANYSPGERDKCLQCGMTDFLSKPYTLDQVAAIVKKY